MKEAIGNPVVETWSRCNSMTVQSNKRQSQQPLKAFLSSDSVRSLLSKKYLLIVVHFIVVGWALPFYQGILVPAADNFLGKALPFSFIPCIIWARFWKSSVFYQKSQ